MQEAILSIMALIWFMTVIKFSLDGLALYQRITPPATLINPITAWKKKRQCIAQYKSGQMKDPVLVKCIKRYFRSLRVCALLTGVLFLLILANSV